MNIDAALAWLRSGHCTENIMVQITSKTVVDELANFVGPAFSNYPLLNANSGILRLAQKDFTDPEGKYYGVVLRASGLGESYSGLLMSGPASGAGSLDIILDDTPLMKEVAALDWSNSLITVKTGAAGTQWSGALPLFKGIIADGEAKNNGTRFSFRVDNLRRKLNEIAYFTNAYTCGFGQPAFGYCGKFPVSTLGLKSGDGDFLYRTSGFASEDRSVKMWNGDTVSSHADSGTCDVEMQGSAAWTLTTTPIAAPANNVFAAVKGYSTGGFIYKAAGIIKKALALGTEGLTGAPSLQDLAIDSSSFDAYDAVMTYQTGYVFGEDKGHRLDAGTTNGADRRPEGWLPALNHLIIGTGGLWGFNRLGELHVKCLLDTPTGTPVLKINDFDYSAQGSDYKAVERIDNVSVLMPENYPDKSTNTFATTSTVGEQDFNGTGGLNSVKLTTALTNTSQGSSFGNRVLNRFGKRDYKLAKCNLYKVLSVGDIVESAALDDYLTNGKKGWVIGGDRGDNPYLEVRF